MTFGWIVGDLIRAAVAAQCTHSHVQYLTPLPLLSSVLNYIYIYI